MSTLYPDEHNASARFCHQLAGKYPKPRGGLSEARGGEFKVQDSGGGQPAEKRVSESLWSLETI